MQEQAQEEQDRRAGSAKTLDTLVATRSETLVLLNELAGMRPFTPSPEVTDLLQEFCEALVDYAAAAHFQLYQYFESGNERRQAVIEIADEVYPKIMKTTAAILQFNDTYDSEERCKTLEKLDDDLSVLGEILADRITLEDMIIAAMTQPKH